jgi:alanyl-tRNA synthetase
MGLATSTQTEWGYYVTGDTDATVIWSDGRRYIQNISFVPAAADDSVIIATSKNVTGAYTNMWSTASAGVAGVVQEIHYDGNVPADNLRVKLSNGGGKVYIYLRSR